MMLKKLFLRSRYEREMAEELRLHLKLETEAFKAAGMNDDEARLAAGRKFGNTGAVQEACRDVQRATLLENFWRDLIYGCRSLRRTPTFALVAVLSLALGIGANTAIFTVVHAFLLQSLPVPNPEGLVLLKVQRPRALLNGLLAADNFWFSYKLFQRLRQQQAIFESMLATTSSEFVETTADGNRSTPGAFVSGDYFKTLRLNPQLGRLLTPADDIRGGAVVAVISDAFWNTKFNRDVQAAGKTIRLEGKSVTVVGVLPESFHGVTVGESPQLFLPLESEAILHAPFSGFDCEDCDWLTVMARLKEGDTLTRLNAKLSAVSKSTFADFPIDLTGGKTRDDVLNSKLAAISGRTGYTYLRQLLTDPLRVLLSLAMLVVLAACANLASLLRARSSARQREFSVRAALGASRNRLIGQVLTETLLLAAAGTLASVPLAYVLARYLVASLFARNVSFQLVLRPSPSVILFMAGSMLLCCLAVGLTPALRVTRFSSPLCLQTRMIFSDRSKRWVPRCLLVFQVALSLLLVSAAILFSGTLFHLREISLGFNPRGVMILSYSWPNGKKTAEEKSAFARRALVRVSTVPGVSSAALAGITPLAGAARLEEVGLAGSSQTLQVWNNMVSPGYFNTMQTRFLEGRDFNGTAADKDSLILSRLLARNLFPDRSAVGQEVLYNKKSHLVIGVVEESKYLSIRNDQSTLFQPGEAWASTLLIRYSGNASSVVTQAAKELRGISPDVLVKTPLSMEKLVDQTLATERLFAALGNFFGALALLLMAIGLYGTLAYVTARRTPEIGIRMALGADRWSVLWTVAKENVAVVFIGALLGVGVSAAAVRYVQSFLYGVKLLDPWLWLAVVGVVGIVAAIATGLPARRAARIEPMEALRSE